MENICLLLNSCDKYSTAWHPFLELIERFWPEYNKPIYLNTEHKECQISSNVITLNANSNITWSERLYMALQNIEEEYIIFSLEDFFLRARVNNDLIKEYLDLMATNHSIGAIRISSHECFVLKNEPYFYKTLKDCPAGYLYRIDTQATIWRKSVLMSLIDKSETPWQFEQNAPKRADKTNLKFLWHYQDNPLDINKMIFPYTVTQTEGYGIAWGHWLWKNQGLFEANNLTPVKYNILGMLSEKEVSKRYKYLYNNTNDYKSLISNIMRILVYIKREYHNIRALGFKREIPFLMKSLTRKK